MQFTIIKILIPAVIAFVVGILITPILTHYLYKYKVWKKTGGKQTLYGTEASEFKRLKGEGETKTPRMGGIVIWGSVVITLVVLYVASKFFPNSGIGNLFFLSRSQTWIPLSTLLVGALIGFLNDYYDVVHGGKGLRLSFRLYIITLLAGAIGWWFYTKLGITQIDIPFHAPLIVGWLIIPIFVLFTIFLYASV